MSRLLIRVLLATLQCAVLLAVVATLKPAAVSAGDESLAGKLLVADRSLRDPRFRHSVIYLVRHGTTGAFGLIVNKPFGSTPMHKLFEGMGLGLDDAVPDIAVAVHYGGPVERHQGSVLHSRDYAVDGTMVVNRDFAMTQNATVIRDIAVGEGPQQHLITFGYSGWGPGQLEGEMERGDWFVVAADRDLVFEENNAKKWEEAIGRRELDL